ncbi:MAG: transporter substrate-binding domain-containing protein [Deltaproteobacteria bacterium]|nr:transporter substrate-binding domain-containing protein [Deltaproteobacteria bacterium]
MKKTKPFITGQHHIQGIIRKFLPPMILAFVFILTASFISTIAAGQEPLSIKVGAYANHPKIFMDANGKVSGFWPDLIEHIAKKENWKIEHIWGTWSEGLDHLINKEIAIMPDVAFTEKRDKLYAFSEAPVLMSWTRVYVNKDKTEIESIRDLKNKKIAALKGSVNLEGRTG